MKKTFMLLATVGFTSFIFATENILPSESMTTVSKSGKPKGWWGGAITKIDTVNVPEKGGRSLYFTGKKMLETSQKVKPGHTYNVSYMLKTKDFIPNQTFFTFQIIWTKNNKYLFTDYKGQKVWHMKIMDAPSTPEWKKISWNCTVPKHANGIYVRIMQKGKNQNASFWLSKWRMVDITPAAAKAKPAAAQKKK